MQLKCGRRKIIKTKKKNRAGLCATKDTEMEMRGAAVGRSLNSAQSYALLISCFIIFNFAQSNRDSGNNNNSYCHYNSNKSKHALDKLRSKCAIQVQANHTTSMKELAREREQERGRQKQRQQVEMGTNCMKLLITL